MSVSDLINDCLNTTIKLGESLEESDLLCINERMGGLVEMPIGELIEKTDSQIRLFEHMSLSKFVLVNTSNEFTWCGLILRKAMTNMHFGILMNEEQQQEFILLSWRLVLFRLALVK